SVPSNPNAWTGFLSVELFPSPKLQNHWVAPDELSVNWTGWPATAVAGPVKAAVGSATGGPEAGTMRPHQVAHEPADEFSGLSAYSWIVQRSRPLLGSMAVAL